MSKAAVKKSTLAKKSDQSSTATGGSQPNIEPQNFQIDLQEQIRKRAYEFYELRCGRDGDELQDWLRAKAEILAELPKK